MRKPKKPTKVSKTKILQKDILTNWDGKTVVEIIVILRDCLLECDNAKFSTDWNYDNTDCMITGVENDDAFDSRVVEYEEKMIVWRKYRIEQLQQELDDVKEQKV